MSKIPLQPPTKLGMYFESAEDYHSTPGYISSSSLPALDKSPAHWLDKHNNGVEPTPAMEGGTFLHALCLEQDVEGFVARPLTDKGTLVPSNSPKYKEFLAENAGKKPIHPKLFDGAYEVLNAICLNKNFVTTYDECHQEVSFYAQDQENGLCYKARLDNLPKRLVNAIKEKNVDVIREMIEKAIIYIHDLKSTGQITRFDNYLFASGYDVRLIHYWQTIRLAILNEFGLNIGDPWDIRFTALESAKPFGSKNIKLRPEDIASAMSTWRRYTNTIAMCYTDGNFPSYSDEWVYASKPTYLDYNAAELSFEV